MNKCNNIKKFLSVICSLMLFLIGLNICSKLVINKTSQQKYAQFREDTKGYDVLFLGSSHVINAISPLDLFRDYGITSFNFSMHGNYARSSYYLLQEALDILERQNRPLPKVVVLDVLGFVETTADLHNAWDSFPLSQTKVAMVQNIVEGNDKLGMLFPFSLYHNRWNELEKGDFLPSPNQWYGAELRYNVMYPGPEIVRDPTDAEKVLEEKVQYLDNIWKYCERKGIEFVLINIPYSSAPDWQREANGIYEYATARGIPYVNFMNEQTGIDYDIDFYDQGHLNHVGMRIMTSQIGSLLTDIGLPDRRNSADASQWISDYESFIHYRIQRLKEQNQIKPYLMSLNDPDLSCSIQICESSLNDIQIRKLVERLAEKGNSISVTASPIQIHSPDGNPQFYDIYCTVWKKGDLENPIHITGFILEGSYIQQ